VLFTPVSAFKAQPPAAANLLASALVPATTDRRWMEGFGFRGELCPELQVFGPCAEPDMPDADASRPVYVQPTGYRVHDTCSTLERGFDPSRVRRIAEAVASYVVARELWTGAGTQADPFVQAAPDGATVNPYLADDNAEVIPDSGSTAVSGELDALGVLEQVAKDRTKGQQVFLHLPIRLITHLGPQLRRVGNEIRTHTDAIVVADAGYPGVGPLDAGTKEVQTVTVTGAPTGGDFTLTYDGQTTATIPFNASAAAVLAALNALSNIAPGDVTVTGAGPYVVTFQTPGDTALMTADGTGLTGGADPDVSAATTTPGVARAPLDGLWAYGTGPVEARLSDVVTNEDMAATINRATNERRVWADRMFAAAYDPCAQFAIHIPDAA
jgi:hypothetical protein